mgnify:CR=1 FL=1
MPEDTRARVAELPVEAHKRFADARMHQVYHAVAELHNDVKYMDVVGTGMLHRANRLLQQLRALFVSVDRESLTYSAAFRCLCRLEGDAWTLWRP